MIELLVVLICLALNAMFACFEMAFILVSKPQLRQMAQAGHRRAKILLRYKEKPERTLSIVQTGITAVALISAAVGGAFAVECLIPYVMQTMNVSLLAARIIAIAAVVLPITFLNVVIGELVPKAIALRRPLSIALFGTDALRIVDTLFSPVVDSFEKTTSLILRYLFRRGKMVREVQANGETIEISHLSAPTKEYVKKMMHAELRQIDSIMVEWSTVAFVDVDEEARRVADLILSCGHTRLPVLENGKPIGVLHTKEFIALIANRVENWHTLIRSTLIAKPTDFALSTLRRMQNAHTNMAIVVDQDFYPIGIVTLEDVIEEIVGELYDEDDDGRIKQIIRHDRRDDFTPDMTH